MSRNADWAKGCLAFVSAITLAALAVGCSGGMTGFGGTSGTTLSSYSINAGVGRAAFQSTLYQFMNTQGCVQCHSGSGPELPFAAPDISLAYAASTGNEIGTTNPLVNFASPDTSLFIAYAGNAHCGLGLCSDATVRPTVQALMEQWAAVEVANGNTGTPTILPTYMSAAVNVPASIPLTTSKTVTYMEIPLSGLNPSVASLGNAVLQIQVQLISAGEYRFTNPRIAGNSASVTITGLHIFIAPQAGAAPGTQDLEQGLVWTSVSSTLATSTLPASITSTTVFTTPLLSSSPLQSEVQSSDTNGNPTDKITIGIDSIQ